MAALAAPSSNLPPPRLPASRSGLLSPGQQQVLPHGSRKGKASRDLASQDSPLSPAGTCGVGPGWTRPSGFCWISTGCLIQWAGGAHPQCHRPPHRCRPCSPRLRHSASAVGCNGHSCTGTGPCHSGECSLSVGMGAGVLIRPGHPCGPALTLRSPTLPPSGLPAHLVGAICTVMIPIAFPAPSDAAAIGTGELTLRAGPGGWGGTGRDRPDRTSGV